MTVLGPRLVVAGTRSGAGKTTVATGLMAALRRQGLPVSSAKVGPDFIDPGYHSLATGRPGRNLDPWMSGIELMAPLAARAGDSAEVLIVEGVMGLFDGAADGSPSSTAEVAKRLDAPVVLVIDASSMSQSVAALVHGYRTWDPKVHVAGVILNMVGSDNHESMLKSALAEYGVPLYGSIRRDDVTQWRSRHLGLQPVAEDPYGVGQTLEQLAATIAKRCDLEGLIRLARSASSLHAGPVTQPRRVIDGYRVPIIVVASGPAFSFCYEDNLEALRGAGAELVPFDPCVDAELPPRTAAVLAGGGFPELFADALAENKGMLASVAAHHRRGGVIWAECGGLLWLSRQLDGSPMAGVIDTEGTMDARRVLGYRAARTTVVSPLGPVETEFRGHEFHYSATNPSGDALVLSGRNGTDRGGFADQTLMASYLHVHLASYPGLAESFTLAASISAIAA